MSNLGAFVPRPILRSAGTHTCKFNQTPRQIARLYGQPESSYRDLIATNHTKALYIHGIPAGSSATFLNMTPGEKLRLPWFWFAGKNEGNLGLLAGGGQGGDVQPDAVATAIGKIIGPFYESAETHPLLPMMANAYSLWWRQDHPGGDVPSTKADLLPYAKSAYSFQDAIASQIQPEAGAAIPWNEVPFRSLAIFLGSIGAVPTGIDWAKVNDYLEKNVQAGAFPAKYTPVDFKQPVDFAVNVPGTNGKWADLPWNVMASVRWDLFPVSYLDTTGLPSDPAKHTAWLIGKIHSALTKKAAQSGSSQDVAPAPSATPPDCSSYGPKSYAEKNAAGLYTGQCITCGKHAFIDTDGLCSCEVGWQLDPTNANNPDCVPIDPNAKTGTNDKMCPNGGTFTVGDQGAIWCQCPDGTKTSTGPTGGCKAATPPPAADESSSSTPILIAAGIALGAVAIYFANRKKK